MNGSVTLRSTRGALAIGARTCFAAGVLLAFSGCLPEPAPPPQAKPKPINPPVAVDPAPEAPPGMVREQATPGVSGKGNYEEGFVTTPIRAYFRIPERIVFDIQIPDAMNKFRAVEGRPPKSHQEFINRIIKENQINLPRLPEGHQYVYDPKAEQLMVEHPR